MINSMINFIQNNLLMVILFSLFVLVISVRFGFVRSLVKIGLGIIITYFMVSRLTRIGILHIEFYNFAISLLHMFYGCMEHMFSTVHDFKDLLSFKSMKHILLVLCLNIVLFIHCYNLLRTDWAYILALILAQFIRIKKYIVLPLINNVKKYINNLISKMKSLTPNVVVLNC